RAHRVDRAADVVRDPDFRYGDPAGVAVHFGFDHARRVRVRGRRPDARTFVAAGRARRGIRAHRAERAEFFLGEHDRLAKAHELARVIGAEHAPTREADVLGQGLHVL